jgi:adenosylcobinamide-GDP ribazoletransferase
VLDDVKVVLLFLTRLPVHVDRPIAMKDLAGAVYLFPLVGALVGAGGALAYLLATFIGLPSAPAAIIGVAAMILLTGALHEDGLADTADGLGAGPDRERALAIMRDSRIGSYGTIALCLTLLLRLIVLASLWGPTLVGGVLIAAAAASRATMPVVMLVQPSAREGGLAARSGRPAALRVALGCALAAAITFVCLPATLALPGLAGAGLFAGMTAWLLGRRLGGCTGDTLGAVQQLGEVGFLLAIVAGQ